MNSDIVLSPLDIDTLREVMNITMAKVADVWAKMAGHCVLINVPTLKLVPINELPSISGDPATQVVGIYFKIHGDILGSVLLVVPLENAMRLVDMLWVYPSGTTKSLSQQDVSALKELGNILTNSFTNALSSLLNLDRPLVSSIPYYANDLLSAVVDFILIEVAEHSDYALLAATMFSDMEKNMQGFFLVFPEMTTVKSIIERLSLAK